jgi:RNA polymerase sigma factor (sigma-70 family)
VTISMQAPATERLSSEQVARLFHSAAAGEKHGWDKLVREFSGMIRAVARAHRLRDADTADVVQSTWLKLLAHFDDLKDPARVGAWLATTARRECLRVLRDSQRHVLFGEDTPDLGATHTPPEEKLMIGERNTALWSSFARLRQNDQTLLHLLMADPRPSYEEISAAMDMPIGSIGPTRQRALDRLREELGRAHSLTLMVT